MPSVTEEKELGKPVDFNGCGLEGKAIVQSCDL
jgi:hypothetical protein